MHSAYVYSYNDFEKPNTYRRSKTESSIPGTKRMQIYLLYAYRQHAFWKIHPGQLSVLLCKAKMQYLLTCKISHYCFFTLYCMEMSD